MTEREQFLEKLSQYCDQQGKIVLLNFYKGVPIKVNAWLKSILADKAVLSVEPPYSICLSWEDETWLQMEETGVTWQATVESFDLLTASVVLGNFKAEDVIFDRRSVIRVEPDAHIQVAIGSASCRLIEYLSDISTKGIGVRIPALESGQVFNKGEAVKIAIKLPQGKVVVPGLIQNITRGKDFYRLGVVFDEVQDHHPIITAYISYRKDAIDNILKIRHNLAIGKQWQDTVMESDAL